MRVVAAVDVLDGTVVRGVAGNRDTYKPIESRLCPGSEPLDIIRALREKCGVGEFYLADLDAILGRLKNVRLYEALAREGVCFWLDAGACHCQDLVKLEACGVKKHVAGLETWGGLKELQLAIRELGDNLMFSLDMKNGGLLCRPNVWVASEPFGMIDVLSQTDLKQLLLLDLARVGGGRGLGTLPLVEFARKASKNWSILAGGGVKSGKDLEALNQSGADGCLVASALHDLVLTREDVLELSRS